MSMNEHLPRPDTHEEIGYAEKCAFVAKAQQIAPYEGQRVDSIGLYETKFEYGNGHVAIDMPVLIDRIGQETDDFTLSDGVAVAVCEGSPIDERYVLVKTRQYIVHLRKMTAEYSETGRVYDSHTNDWQRPAFSEYGAESAIRSYDDEEKLGLHTFSRERFHEVSDILDQLRPEDRF